MGRVNVKDPRVPENTYSCDTPETPPKPEGEQSASFQLKKKVEEEVKYETRIITRESRMGDEKESFGKPHTQTHLQRIMWN